MREFNIGDFERDLDVDLENDLYVSYEGRPAIIVESAGQLQETMGQP